MKYLTHMIKPSASAIPTNSASVDLAVFSFCFLDKLRISPFPMDITAPVRLLKSQWVPYKASTYQRTTFNASALSYSFMYRLTFKYFRPRFNFPHSSLSGDLTITVRKETRGCISGRALIHNNKSWVTVWWNFCACSSGSNFLSFSSHTWTRCSDAWVAAVLLITSRNFSMAFWRYLIMKTIIVPSWIQSMSIPRYSCTLPLVKTYSAIGRSVYVRNVVTN